MITSFLKFEFEVRLFILEDFGHYFDLLFLKCIQLKNVFILIKTVFHLIKRRDEQ